MPEQFILPLTKEPVLDAGNFIVARCNQQAVEFVRRWPDWPSTAAALFGPKACGKSHLARIWAGMAQATIISAPELITPAGRKNSSTAFVIEDLDRTPADAARDHILIGLLDRPGVSVLLTGRAPPTQWPVATGDWHSRLQSLIGFEMWSPDDEFLSALVKRHFAERQLHPSASVVSHILAHVERTPDAIAGFVDSIDHRALSEKRPLSLRLVMEMIGNNDSATSCMYSEPVDHRI
jgi:chromosomal replication initiation ATPase DnaA